MNKILSLCVVFTLLCLSCSKSSDKKTDLLQLTSEEIQPSYNQPEFITEYELCRQLAYEKEFAASISPSGEYILTIDKSSDSFSNSRYISGGYSFDPLSK